MVTAWTASLIGKPAVPLILKAIPSNRGNKPIRNIALEEIEWTIKTVGLPAIPHLLAALESENSIAVELAMKALRDLNFSDMLHLTITISLYVITNRMKA